MGQLRDHGHLRPSTPREAFTGASPFLLSLYLFPRFAIHAARAYTHTCMYMCRHFVLMKETAGALGSPRLPRSLGSSTYSHGAPRVRRLERSTMVV